MSYINSLKQNITKTCKAKSAGEFCQLDQIIEALEVNASVSIIDTFGKMG